LNDKNTNSFTPKTKSGKKRGGQKGRTGTSLTFNSTPDSVVLKPVAECEICHKNLQDTPVGSVSIHQVVDVELKVATTEYHIEHKNCNCGHYHSGANLVAPVQYGPSLKAIAVELNQVQCLPAKRTAEFLQQKFDLTISPATILSYANATSNRLRTWEDMEKQDLLKEHTF